VSNCNWVTESWNAFRRSMCVAEMRFSTERVTG
jgi:hypothetical protein